MFVALTTDYGHTHIDMQTLYGAGDVHHVIESQLGDKDIQFAVDRHVNEIFFCDSEAQQISWTDFAGER